MIRVWERFACRSDTEKWFLRREMERVFRPTEVLKISSVYETKACTHTELRSIIVTDRPSDFVLAGGRKHVVYYLTADIFAPLVEVDDAVCRKLNKLSIAELRWLRSAECLQLPDKKQKSWARKKAKEDPPPEYCPAFVTKTVGKTGAQYEMLDSVDKVEAFLKKLDAAQVVALDAETKNKDPWSGTLCITLSLETGTAVYVPRRFIPMVVRRLNWSKVVGQNLVFDLQAVAEVMQSPPIAAIDYASMLRPWEYPDRVGGDSLILASLLEVPLGSRGLKQQVQNIFGFQMVEFDEVAVDGTLEGVDELSRLYYACSDADWTRQLVLHRHQQLQEERLTSAPVYELQLRMIPIAAEMEANGVFVDVDRLQELAVLQDTQIAALVKSLEVVSGKKFNPGSPEQVAGAVFDDDVEPLVFGKKGPSTAEAVLEKIDSPTAELVLEWRGLSKLRGTYTDALLNSRHPRDGRIHPKVNMATVASGRWSMSNPNFQNIPKTKLYRGCIMAEPGRTLVKADYNQLELRVLAGLIGHGTMFDIYKRGGDIHAFTAEIIHGEKIGPDDERRQDGKRGNFSIVYGAREGKLIEAGLAKDWEEARLLLDQLNAAFPDEMDYIAAERSKLKKNRVVLTRLGRWRSFGDYVPLDVMEREGFNHIIQGSGAELVFTGMVAARPVLREYGARLINQVHDEVLVELAESEVHSFKQELVKALESPAFALDLVVEAKVGTRWG